MSRDVEAAEGQAALAELLAGYFGEKLSSTDLPRRGNETVPEERESKSKPGKASNGAGPGADE